MGNTLDPKLEIDGSVGEPKKTGAMQEPRIELGLKYEFDDRHVSWWSIVYYWIRELRWRRALWEKMRRLTPEKHKP